MSLLSTKTHPNLTPHLIEVLSSKKIFTVINFLATETQQIIKITQLTFKEILDIKNHLLKTYSAPAKNAFKYYKTILKNCAIISTGIKKLVDELLEGGFLTGNIYELCGLPASGKTQFCLTIMKNIAMNQEVFYMDTKYNLNARKLNLTLQHSNKEQTNEILNRILIKRITTKSDLILSLEEIKFHLETNNFTTRFIIIDSLPAILLESITETMENAVFLTKLVNLMHFIAVEYHIVFLITNLIINKNYGNLQSEEEKIVCGKFWKTIPNARLKIVKNETNLCKFSIVESDFLLSNTVNLTITNEGII